MAAPHRLIASRAAWKPVTAAGATGYAAGRSIDLSRLVSALDAGASGETIAACCDAWLGPFAVILKGKDWIFAAADKARRIPVFYATTPDGLIVGDDALKVRAAAGLGTPDVKAMIEFRLAGYVSGRRTLFERLEQVLPAEYILARDGLPLERRRYFDFPSADLFTARSTDDLIEEADATMDRAVARAIEDAAGRPLWVALSAGLDSRLVLAKLKAQKYDNLTAFTYGAPANYESKGARYVAEKIGVPWVWIPDTMAEGRRLAASGSLPALWEFASGLSSTPMVVDTPCISKVARTGQIPKDALIVNGQSGDYITGGHLIDKLVTGGTLDDMHAAIRAKHYGLLGREMSDRHAPAIDAAIDGAIASTIAGEAGRQSLWQAALNWEWQERQSKFVVNGQRIYEHYGYDWLLPLWDDELMSFWARVDPARLSKQSLFKASLERPDLYGVFRDFPVTVWRWPGAMIAVIPIARAAGLLLGEQAKKDVYRIGGYLGHTRYLWAQQGFATYLRESKQIRNFHALNAKYVLEHLMRITGCPGAIAEIDALLAPGGSATSAAA